MKRVKNGNSIQEVLKEMDLDFQPKKVPLFTKEGTEIWDKVAVVRHIDSQEVPLGVVGPNYKIVPYPQAFEILEDVLEKEFEVTHAYSFGNGRVAVLYLEGKKGVISFQEEGGGSTTVKNYLMVSSSHDGSRKIEIHHSPQISTSNQKGTAIIKTGIEPILVKHKRNALERLSFKKRLLILSQNFWGRFENEVGSLLKVHPTSSQVEKYLYDIYGESKRSESVVETIKENFIRGRYAGVILPQCRGTLFGLYMAIVEFEEQKSPNRRQGEPPSEEDVIYHKIFGTAAAKKAKAYAFFANLVNN